MICVEDLRCGYAEHPVLKGISFRVDSGDFIGVLGPNGSGKTTLLMALSGATRIQSGRIHILDRPLEKLKPKERARLLAVVSQDAALRFPFSCEDVVRMGRYPHQDRWQVDTPHDESVVRHSLEITDTQLLADRLITAISGGERQRVFMAKALAQEAPILLLDEATSAMDIHRKLEIFRVLEDLNHEKHLTILAVMHDVNLAALFCRRLIFIRDGVLVADGPTESVLTSEILEEVYQTRVIVENIGGIGKRQVVFLPEANTRDGGVC